jgi:hypothetical protein
VDGLIRQLAGIVGDERTARALFVATARFHDPAHATTWGDPRIDEEFEGVWELLAQAQAMARPA